MTFIIKHPCLLLTTRLFNYADAQTPVGNTFYNANNNVSDGTTSINQFFLLVFALSIPFWLLGFIVKNVTKTLPIKLPISALMAVCPLILRQLF
jgi:hypothetical protein